jgi:hypothetical protein
MTKVCKCRAYNFPHRLFSGSCLANEQGPYCGNCGQPCQIEWVDDGHGQTEFWGIPGFDTNRCPTSDCCEDLVFTDASLNKEF